MEVSATMSGLFRKEVIEAKRGSWLGAINVATPLSGWVIAWGAIGMAGLIVAFLIFGHYTKRERVTGELVPSAGLLDVRAAAGGVVRRVDVQEGQHVHRGDELAEISVDVDSARLGDTRARISRRLQSQRKALHGDLDTQVRRAAGQSLQLKTRLALLASQIRRINTQAALQQQEIHADLAMLHRIQPLASKGYVSAFRVQQQRSAWLAAKAQLQALERQRAQVEQQVSDAQQQLVQIPLNLKMQRSSTQRQLDGVAQQLVQNEAERSIVLRSPRDGVVSSLLISAGQSVVAGQTLLNVMPEGSRLTARLLVSSRAVGFVDPGSKVVLRYQAYPYQKFGQYYGRVRAISRSALSPRDVASLTGVPAKQPLYQVTVSLNRQTVMAYGKPQKLKPGMVLSADILMDRRRLIEWVFEPLYGIGRRAFDGGSVHG